MRYKLVSLYRYNKAHFYTVQLVDADLQEIAVSEFDDFQNRMDAGSLLDISQLEVLYKMISNIGKIYGATFEQFKREREFERLPKATYSFLDSVVDDDDFGLRLYCLRVDKDDNNKIVILLNGCRKTAQSAQECPNCRNHFDFANRFTTAFYNSLLKDDIEIDDFDLKTEKDFYLNF